MANAIPQRASQILFFDIVVSESEPGKSTARQEKLKTLAILLGGTRFIILTLEFHFRSEVNEKF